MKTKQELIYNYTALGVISLTLIIIVCINSASEMGYTKGQIKCSINNIEYTNVSPLKCYSDSLSSDFCPLPKDIECDVNGELPINTQMLTTILKNG